MPDPEEFEIIIGDDGRIRLDVGGVTEESYRRIVELLEETVGPIESIEVAADGGAPPTVSEYHEDKIDASESEELKNEQGA